MRIVDPKLRQNWKNYLFQPLWGASMVMLLMFLSNVILFETIIASLGASIFIVTSMPHTNGAKPRYLIGGYACGIIAGLSCFFLLTHCPWLPLALIAGIAVGMAIILMVCFNFEHPPAAALALGLVLSPHPPVAALVAFFCIILVCLVGHLAKKKMCNLL